MGIRNGRMCRMGLWIRAMGCFFGLAVPDVLGES